MLSRLILIIMALTINGCMTVRVEYCGQGDVYVSLDKPISTSTLPMDLKARDVTVPVMP